MAIIARFAPALWARVRFTLLALAALAVLAGAQVLAIYVFLLATMLAFLGSTGSAHAAFVRPFAPIAYFAAGALASAGLLTLVNGIVAPHRFWLKSVIAAAFVGGLAVAVLPNLGSRLTELAIPVLQKIWNLREAGRDREKALVVEFVKRQSAVADAVGRDFQASVSTTTLVRGTPVRYDVYVSGEKRAHAIVEVGRASGRVEFTLACVTTRGPGERRSHTHPCEQ